MQAILRNGWRLPNHGSSMAHRTATLLCLIWLVSTTGSSPTGAPITRDDFICCDTTADSLGNPVWPSVALDESGNICLTYLRQQITENETALRLFLGCLDHTGVLQRPDVRILPDTLPGDSVWWPSGPTPVAGNDRGQFFLPVHATVNDTHNQTLGRGILYYAADFTGMTAPEPAKVNFIPMEGKHYRPHMAVGDINNPGICGAAWVGRQAEAPYHAKLFVRLYDADSGELRGFVVPSSRLSPPDSSGLTIDRRPEGPPALAINDSGGFAVAWTVEGEGDARLLYAVYNSSGEPRGPVRFADSGNTAGDVVRTVNMAGEADGDFYLVWSADRAGTAEHHCRTHLWMRGFSADGSPKHDAVRVDDADSTNIIDVGIVYPSIACDDSGNVLIAWADGRLHPDTHSSELRQDVFVQRFAPDGSRVGGNVRVNNACGMAGLKGTNSDCALNNAGQAMVVWREFGEANTIKSQMWPLASIGESGSGDLNCDLTADQNDLAVLRDYLLGSSPNTFWPRSRADLNGDGRVDISDLAYLTDFLHNGGDAPVPAL